MILDPAHISTDDLESNKAYILIHDPTLEDVIISIFQVVFAQRIQVEAAFL
jgi:hypothetical protein